MNNTIQKDITNDFTLADLLSQQIKANVLSVAQEVILTHQSDSQHIDSARCGAYECWIQRLTGMLEKNELDYLLDLMQKRVDEVKERD